jgi:hypothetical protein
MFWPFGFIAAKNYLVFQPFKFGAYLMKVIPETRLRH